MRIARFSVFIWHDIDFGMQKTDQFIITGMAGSVDRYGTHIDVSSGARAWPKVNFRSVFVYGSG